MSENEKALRERIARALFLHQYPESTAAWGKPDEGNREVWYGQADAVLAVLPADGRLLAIERALLQGGQTAQIRCQAAIRALLAQPETAGDPR